VLPGNAVIFVRTVSFAGGFVGGRAVDDVVCVVSPAGVVDVAGAGVV
jgi:hypothetical protein